MIPAPRGARTLARSGVLALFAALACAAPAAAQLGGSVPAPEKLVKIEVAPVTIAAGAKGEATLKLTIAPTWHINANPPSPDYMIPTVLKVEPAGGIQAGEPVYPAPHMVKLGFDESELFVYDGEAGIKVPLEVGADAASGRHELKGTLRFQSCNDQVCLPPHTLPVALIVNVTGGAAAQPEKAAPAAPATGGTGTPAAEPGAGRSPPAPAEPVPPAGNAAGAAPEAGAPAAGMAQTPDLATHAAARSTPPDNPIAHALEKGSFATFITLFLIGLALNLTPCVYPMLGVTVSIFGGRGKTPPLQALGMAVVYVMGIALMYSVLGVAAAFSGGLFGSALQSPIVLVLIGVLLVGLSLSMFGLYEIQLPPSLMMKLGGQTATGVAGTFLSGLLVGVFAAPCIGPPIVALLAIVGAKGDPVFGFTSFFTLSLGLGAPYLVLGTFSNLLTSLPKSGEWMIWVKKVFGVILLSIGVFYAMLAFAPQQAPWVAPVALLAGGLYLGFIEKSKGRNKAFLYVKQLGGIAAMTGGAFIVVAALTANTLAFHEFDDGHLQSALQDGRNVLMDFSADWCVPCHELEQFTFTDHAVIAAAQDFVRFKVDLTHYDSPESEQLRRQYDITGVPTIVFLTPDGQEVRAARVEGFLPPERFLRRMQMARTAGQRAQR